MVGKIFDHVAIDDDAVVFVGDDMWYKFYHSQDCCESVWVDEVHGDIKDLIGTPILSAEEAVNPNEAPDRSKNGYSDESYTWTFYRFATIKGYVTIKFYGTSNGYYSESVSVSRFDGRADFWDTLKGR